MRDLKTILAAIHMTTLDEEVIKRALLIARETNAQLHFVYAIDIPVMDIEITSEFLKREFDKDAIKKETLNKIDALNLYKGVKYIVHITIGDAVEQVIHIAEKIKADLVVIGSTSKAKIEEYYLGSTSQKIAQEGGYPVLVVKNNVEGSYKNILATTNFSDSSKKSVLFAQIAFKSSPISLLHAYKDLDDLTINYYKIGSEKSVNNQEFLGRPHADIFKQDVGIKKLDIIKSSSSIDKSLLEYIKNKKSDLIVIGSSGSDIAGSFLSSTATYLLRKTLSDVLIYIPLNK
ncbi:universal stress protein [Candidatus Sulfurimonas baltica]|uniref:Universal stress protein n=1 Tax=Candidatus Sulfurimonas baltica TaxID=2740404 RepID=A0A7S7LTX9_9BACT|nr:universal stress protein [Candidatus Sulfurimonas baltica]QOY51467.1 universal stress protein [Candidatus Sulfurimonas baltica]